MACASDFNGKGASHAPVPFYVSTAGYGVVVDSARYLTFSVGEKQRLADVSKLTGPAGEQKIITNLNELYGAEHRDKTSVYVDVPAARGVDIYLFAGPAMGQAVARYNLFSGGGCLPALEGLGPRYQFGAMLDAKGVLAMCDQFKRSRIPITVGSDEIAWETRRYPSSYVFDTAKFTDDIGVRVREKGYGLGLWCQLYIHPESPLVPIFGNRIGDFEVWRGIVPDLVDPSVRNDYRDFLVTNFLRKGITSFKLDEVDGSGNIQGANAEWQFPEFTIFPSGADGEQMRNLLGRLGLEAIDAAFRKENRRTFGLVRATQAWSAPLSAVVYSDEYSFEDYIRYNLSAGVQGVLWTPELRDANSVREYALRTGAVSLSAMMLINAWQFPHVPWSQPKLSANEQKQLLPEDNPYARLTRRFCNLRMMLLPYLYAAYGDYHRKGISPVRPLVSDWPEDVQTHHIEDQWMLGSDLMVAPLTGKNAFEQVCRSELAGVSQFKADRGVGVTFNDGVLDLAIQKSAPDGLCGGNMEVDLKPGACELRLSSRGDIGSMATRLYRMDGSKRVGDIQPVYKDDIRVDGDHWTEQIFHLQIPTAGRYCLVVSKGYFLRPADAKHLQVRDVVFEQPQGKSELAWKRNVYLPAGQWRDFWTGKLYDGSRKHIVEATPECPLIFVRDGTLLPLAEPLVTIDDKTVFAVHLAAYGESPRPFQLLEDDGVTFDYEKGKWATVTVRADGTADRPDHGQPLRYKVVDKAENPESLLKKLLTTE